MIKIRLTTQYFEELESTLSFSKKVITILRRLRIGLHFYAQSTTRRTRSRIRDHTTGLFLLRQIIVRADNLCTQFYMASWPRNLGIGVGDFRSSD